MIKIKVDRSTLSHVEKKLGALKNQAPKVIARGLNKTAEQARKKLADQARQTYTVKKPNFYKDMQIKKAFSGNLEAIIKSQGKPLKLTSFKYSSSKNGVKAAVLASSGLKLLIMGNIKAFKGENGQIWQRRTTDRLPIKVLSSNSIPKMIGNERRVYGIVKPEIQSDLRKNIDAQIKLLVG